MRHRIRTTFQPDTEIEVEGPEYLDLLKQGVVLHPLPAPAADPEASPFFEPVTARKADRRPAAGKSPAPVEN